MTMDSPRIVMVEPPDGPFRGVLAVVLTAGEQASTNDSNDQDVAANIAATLLEFTDYAPAYIAAAVTEVRALLQAALGDEYPTRMEIRQAGFDAAMTRYPARAASGGGA